MRERLGRPGFRMRLWTATLAVAALALFVAAPAAQAVPAKFWGVVPQATPTAEQFQRLKRGGVDSLRIPVFWGAAQPVQGGAFDWSHTDQLVAGATAVGIEVLPFLYGAPTWAVPADRAIPSHPPKYLPVRSGLQRSGWTRFLRETISRYGPNGSFWAQNPALPKRPIRTWQLWNEQNFKYFVARPSPAEYGKLVTLSYPAIKAADPGARIVLGGMFSAPKEAEIKRGPPQAFFASDFLELMYRSTPGVKRKFHGVAVHPYTEAFQRIARYVEEIRDVLMANRDAGKGVWLTELSWSSHRSSAGNFAKGIQGQAKQLRGAFGLLRANQRKWNVKRVYWFSVDDQEDSCNFCDGSGLFGPGFVPKPSWFAFTAFSGGKP